MSELRKAAEQALLILGELPSRDTEQRDRQGKAKDALRAALAEPAPEPVRGLKGHEVAALINRLRDIAVEFHSAQQLRERIAGEIRPLLIDGVLAAPMREATAHSGDTNANN